MRLGLAKHSEIAELTKLFNDFKEINPSNLPFTEADIEYMIFDKDGLFLVAHKGKKIIGFLFCKRESPKNACIVYMGVKKEFRGNELGTCLIEEMLARIKDNALESCYVLSSNCGMTNFMKCMGFTNETELTYLDINLKPKIPALHNSKRSSQN